MTQALFTLIVGTLVRSLVMIGAGWLVAHGMLPQGTMEDWVGAVVLVLVGLGWGLYQKYVAHVQLLTALESPPGMTLPELRAKISDGKGATLVTTLLVVFVSLGLLTGATCHGKQSPRHDTTLNLQTLTTSLRALQEGEQSLYKAKTIPQLTPEAHKLFNGKMVEVWDALSAAVSVVQAWRPGQPVPAQLVALVEKTRVAVEAAATVFGAYVPQKITDVWKALADILLQTIGGVQ